MVDKHKKNFIDYFDTIIVISNASKENLGEDSFYCAGKNKSAIVSVFDGCGGLGAHKYDVFKGHTGAYMASRIVSAAVCDWYQDNYDKSWTDIQKMVDNINEYIRKAYDICGTYSIEKMKIRGSMVRSFPSTLALAYAEKNTNEIIINIMWAGDSRIYLLDEDGLAQITKDDTEVEDAFENLSNDGALSNVLSSDGNYVINYKIQQLTKPAMIFAATDGCFSYIPSPMEFEYMILKTLNDSDTPISFQNILHTKLCHYAGDDLALGLMAFNFGDFNSMKKAFLRRITYLEEKYINILNKEKNYECAKRLWKEYKIGYERYL